MINAPSQPISLRLHQGRLLISPANPQAVAAVEQLLGLLHDGGLIGDRVTSTPARYSPGSRFFEYLGFTGCAVQLDQGSTSGEAGVEIGLEGPFAIPRPYLGRNTRPPGCPHCRRALTDWRLRLDQASSQDRPRLRCSDCGRIEPAWEWNWGRQGGFGRQLIQLEPVFPGEARPLPALFALLEPLGVGLWRYFYMQDGSTSLPLEPS
jgi:hypothetical protein